MNARRPDVLIVAESFAQRYIPRAMPPGYRLVQEARAQQDVDAVAFFSAALRDQLPGYHLRWIAAPARQHRHSHVGTDAERFSRC